MIPRTKTLSNLQGMPVLCNTVFQTFCMKNSLYCMKKYICVCTHAACLCIIPTNRNLVSHVRYSYQIYMIWKINSTSGMWVPWVAGKMSIYIQPPARPFHGWDGWLRHLTTDIRVQSQASLGRIFSGQSDTGTGFAQSTSVSPVSIILPIPLIFHQS